MNDCDNGRHREGDLSKAIEAYQRLTAQERIEFLIAILGGEI